MAALFACLLPAFQDLFPLDDALDRSLGHIAAQQIMWSLIVGAQTPRLQLPANPLDEIMKKLGGPRKASREGFLVHWIVVFSRAGGLGLPDPWGGS